MELNLEQQKPTEDSQHAATMQISGDPPAWTFPSFKYSIRLRLDQNNEPLPENAEHALYLAYLYLGYHQPERAFTLLNDLPNDHGGLNGSANEIELVQKILDEIIPNTPPYVVCQLKTLVMFVEWVMINQQQTLPLLEELLEELDETIVKLYKRYLKMRKDLICDLKLKDEENFQLLHYLVNFSSQDQRCGSIAYEYELLKIKKQILEKSFFDKLESKNSRLPYAYQKRRDEIKRALDHETTVCGYQVDFYKINLNENISLFNSNTPPASYISEWEKIKYHSFQKKSSDKTNEAMSLLSMNMITRYDYMDNFLKYLPIYLGVLITNKYPEFRQKLIAFCYQYCYEYAEKLAKSKEDSKKFIYYLCEIFLRIDQNMGFCIDILPLDGFLTLFNYNIKNIFWWAEKTLPNAVLNFYKRYTQTQNFLTLNPMNLGQDSLMVDIPIVAKESQTLQQFTLVKLLDESNITQPSRDLLSEYKRQDTVFISPPDITIDKHEDECSAGALHAHAFHKMKSIAEKLLNNNDEIGKLKKKALDFIKSLEKITLNRLEMALALANQGFESNLHREIELYNGLRAPLCKEKLLSLYFKANQAEYARCTGLSNQKITQLHNFINSYIQLTVRQQTLQRMVDKLNAYENNPTDTNAQLAISELMVENLVNYSCEPILGYFQYAENILLKPSQISALKRMTQSNDDCSYAEVVEKIIMGGGKSKVLLPLLAKYKATGTNLVVIEVPRNLLETNFSDLSKTSARLFEQKAVIFDFKRTTDISLVYLELSYNKLCDVMRQQNYIVTTGEAVQSLGLKYIELLCASPTETEEQDLWQKQIVQIEKIIQLFLTRSDVVIDEGHLGLFLRKKLNYTLGDEKALSPWLIQKTVKLYEFFKVVQIKDNLLFSDLVHNNQHFILDSEWSEAMRKLAQALIDHPQSPLKDSFNLNEAEKKAFINYLFNTAEIIPEFVMKAPLSIRNEIALYKLQISHLLPLTLRRNLNEHYGSSHTNPEIVSAIPYIANNKPNEGCRFGFYIAAMNYTIQMNLIQGLSKSLIITYISSLQEKGRLELLRNAHMQDLNQTSAGHAFAKITSLYQLSKIDLRDEKQLEQISIDLRHNKLLISEILELLILPQQKINHRMISSEAFAHVDLYRSCQVVTGTPDEFTTWHSRLHYDKQQYPATNGFIIDLLKRKSTKVHSIPKKSNLQNDIRHLLLGKPVVHAIIDICAFFQGTSNESVAKELAEYYHQNYPARFNYVLYFNQENILCALSTDGNARIKVLNSSDPSIIDETLGCGPHHRITYFDQAHSTGTDLKQTMNAKALALVDHRTELPAFLQGVMRMRGLPDEQSIDLVVPQALAHQSFESLLQMFADNHQKTLIQDNFDAALGKMKNVVRSFALKRILNGDTLLMKQKIFNQYQQFFIQEMPDDAQFFNQHGSLMTHQDTKRILESYRDTLISIDTEISALKPQFDDIILNALKICAPTYPKASQVETDLIIEVELQMEQEQQHEHELKIVMANLSKLSYWPWKISPSRQIYARATQFLSLKQIAATANQHAPDFDKIYASRNYYQVYSSQNIYLNEYLKPVHALLFRKLSGDEIDCVILSQQEAHDLAQLLMKKPEPNVWIANTAMTLLAGSPPKDIKKNVNYQILIEQVRFFAGELNLLESGDIPFRWLLKDTTEKLNFFKKYLLPYRETKIFEIDKLAKTLEVYRLALDCVCQHPEIDYSTDDWQQTVWNILNQHQDLPVDYIYVLKGHTLFSITELMSKQSNDLFVTFLKHQKFIEHTGQFKELLNLLDQKTKFKLLQTVETIPNVTPEVKNIAMNVLKDSCHAFYRDIFFQIGLVTGIAGLSLFVFGLINGIIPLLLCGGGLLIVAGISTMGFFKQPAHQDKENVIIMQNSPC